MCTLGYSRGQGYRCFCPTLHKYVTFANITFFLVHAIKESSCICHLNQKTISYSFFYQIIIFICQYGSYILEICTGACKMYQIYYQCHSYPSISNHWQSDTISGENLVILSTFIDIGPQSDLNVHIASRKKNRVTFYAHWKISSLIYIFSYHTTILFPQLVVIIFPSLFQMPCKI